MESKIQYKLTYLQNRLTDIENRFMVTNAEGCGGRIDQEFRLSRRKLLLIEWINNMALMYSTGNYIQYPGINHSGKEYKKRTYVCV